VGNLLVGTSEVFQAVMVCITLSTIINANIAKIASKQFNFFQDKRAVLVRFGTHDTLQSRQSALATGLPGQLSRHGLKSTTLYDTWQRQTSMTVLLAH
jgi:acyl CoA:acetate/3-ketoacid CoA transferase alpha subunit